MMTATLMASRTIHLTLPFAFSILLSVVAVHSGTVQAQKTNNRQLAPIDLLKIQHIASKGRIQDSEYNPLLQAEIDALIAQGPSAIDSLIAQLTDQRVINHHVLDFWPTVRVGDVALIVLSDLFTDTTQTQNTIPGASWDEILERKDRSLSAKAVHNNFVRRYGRNAIQKKWKTLWQRYKAKVSWDEKGRCFRLLP